MERRELDDVAARIMAAADQLHYAAHLLGDAPAARRLRRIAEVLHQVARDLKRG